MRSRVRPALAALLFSAVSVTAQAEEPREARPEATEIVVRGARREDTGTLVDTLRSGDLEQLGVPTVGEALERLPSTSAGSDSRGERLLSLRGFEQRQLAVFIDGVPVSVPYDGQIDLSKLPIDLVDRITVVKGAAAALYGPNGLGGAVNIVTREPGQGPLARFATESSPWRETRAGGALSLGFSRGGVLLGAGFENIAFKPMSRAFRRTYNEDGGHRNNTDRQDRNVSAKAVYDVDDRHRLTLSLTHIEGSFGVAPGVHDFNVRFWRWSDWYTSTLGLSHSFRSDAWSVESLAYASWVGNTLDTYDDASYTTQRLPRTFTSVYDDKLMGAMIRTSYVRPIAPGQQWAWRSWYGIKHDMHASQDVRDAPWKRATSTLLTAAGLLEADVLPALRATLGAQFDGELPGDAPAKGEVSPPASGLGPMGSLSYAPSSRWSVSLSGTRRARFPTLKERFSTAFGGREPNPLLAPEQATNVSVDVVLKPVRELRVAAGVFASNLDGVIQPVLIALQTEQLQNVGDGRIRGVELDASYSPAEWLSLRASWMRMNATVRPTGGGADLPAFYKPKHKGLGLLTLHPHELVSITGIVRVVGEQTFQNGDTGLLGRLGGYQLFDARVDMHVSRALRVWVRGTNLADTNVEGRYSFPESGRELFVGLASAWAPPS